jgi:hypothetical protein
MEKIPRLRKRTQRLLALIENDMLAKLGREPDQIDRDLIPKMVKLALGIRIDAGAWKAEYCCMKACSHSGFPVR